MRKYLFVFLLGMFIGFGNAFAEDEKETQTIDQGCTSEKPVKYKTGTCYSCDHLKIRSHYERYLKQCPKYRTKYISPDKEVIDIPEVAKQKGKENLSENGNDNDLTPCPREKPARDKKGICRSCSDHLILRNASHYTSVCAHGESLNRKRDEQELEEANNSFKNGFRTVNTCPIETPAMDRKGKCHPCSDALIIRNPGRYANVCSGGKPVNFKKKK